MALHGKNANLTQNETYNQFLFERINEQSREEGNTQAWVEVELVGKEEIDGEEFELTLRVRRKWKIISDRKLIKMSLFIKRCFN